MTKFIVKEQFQGKVIMTKDYTVGLYLSKPSAFNDDMEQQVYFMDNEFQYLHQQDCEGWMQSIKSTARELSVYPKEVRDAITKPCQYLEVGAGLGEPISVIVRRYKEPNYIKPIAVDPAKYELFADMLAFSKGLVRECNPRIDILLARCEIMLDKNKVYLVRKKLEDAWYDLRDVADIVVDFWGPKANSDLEEKTQQRIDDAELAMAKPSGKVVQICRGRAPRTLDKSGNETPIHW